MLGCNSIGSRFTSKGGGGFTHASCLHWVTPREAARWGQRATPSHPSRSGTTLPFPLPAPPPFTPHPPTHIPTPWRAWAAWGRPRACAWPRHPADLLSGERAEWRRSSESGALGWTHQAAQAPVPLQAITAARGAVAAHGHGGDRGRIAGCVRACLPACLPACLREGGRWVGELRSSPPPPLATYARPAAGALARPPKPAATGTQALRARGASGDAVLVVGATGR